MKSAFAVKIKNPSAAATPVMTCISALAAGTKKEGRGPLFYCLAHQSMANHLD
ncbi:MAG: hypothetical protein ABWY08_09225 [Comamonas sp.]